MEKVWRKRENPKAPKRDSLLEPTEARGDKRQQSRPGGDVGPWCYFPQEALTVATFSCLQTVPGQSSHTAPILTPSGNGRCLSLPCWSEQCGEQAGTENRHSTLPGAQCFNISGFGRNGAGGGTHAPPYFIPPNSLSSISARNEVLRARKGQRARLGKQRKRYGTSGRMEEEEKVIVLGVMCSQR